MEPPSQLIPNFGRFVGGSPMISVVADPVEWLEARLELLDSDCSDSDSAEDSQSISGAHSVSEQGEAVDVSLVVPSPFSTGLRHTAFTVAVIFFGSSGRPFSPNGMLSNIPTSTAPSTEVVIAFPFKFAVSERLVPSEVHAYNNTTSK